MYITRADDDGLAEVAALRLSLQYFGAAEDDVLPLQVVVERHEVLVRHCDLMEQMPCISSAFIKSEAMSSVKTYSPL